MKFSVGQKVVFLHEEGGGEIESFSENIYSIRDEHGFLTKYKESDLAAVHSVNHSLEHGEFEKAQEPKVYRGKAKENVLSIDLHIEELVDDHSGMSNFDIIQKQMRELRIFVGKAQDKKVRRIVVIHGVGEGVLRSEVRQFFRGISGTEFYDGNYWEYGQGATVVELKYKY